MEHPPNSRIAVWLWFLLVLFILRVLGQLLVALGATTLLPPMEEWFSGTIPYPWLVCCQVGLIVLFGKVCLDFTRGEGFFVVPRRKLGLGLLSFGSVYLAVMILRYVIRMSLYPLERWTGGSIPIFFHWVLASFLLIIGPWAHGRNVTFPGGLTTRNYRLESLAPSVAWFDQHLRGTQPLPYPDPPVRIFVIPYRAADYSKSPIMMSSCCMRTFIGLEYGYLTSEGAMPKAFIMIDVIPGHEAEIQKQVSKLAGVVMVHEVTGNADLIAFVDAEPYEEFAMLLSTIRRLDGVRDTDSHLVLEKTVTS